MGYNTKMHGQFTVTPPIPWIDYRDKPFDPTSIENGEYRCVQFVIEAVEVNGALMPAVTGLKVAHYGDGSPDVEAEFRELFALYPNHSFNGVLQAQGEEVGDLWRLEVNGRTMIHSDAVTSDPNVTATLVLMPGQVQCSDGGVLQVLDEPRVKAWEVDLVSKYPGNPYYSLTWADESGVESSEDVATFMIHVPSSPDTLRVDPSADSDTTFAIYGLARDWIVMAEARRYTVRIVAYRPKGTPDA